MVAYIEKHFYKVTSRAFCFQFRALYIKLSLKHYQWWQTELSGKEVPKSSIRSA
jgi:hypothetical protein